MFARRTPVISVRTRPTRLARSPTFRTALVVPAACRTKSQRTRFRSWSGFSRTLSTISPPCSTIRTQGAICVIAVAGSPWPRNIRPATLAGRGELHIVSTTFVQDKAFLGFSYPVSAIIFGPRRTRRWALIGLALQWARRDAYPDPGFVALHKNKTAAESPRRPPTANLAQLPIGDYTLGRDEIGVAKSMLVSPQSQRMRRDADAIAAARSRFRRTCGARAHHKTKGPPSRPLTDPLLNHFSPGKQVSEWQGASEPPARHRWASA
jgi:hypothetical protein